MTNSERFKALWFQINNLNAEIRELSEKKWEIEGRIDALTDQVHGFEKEVSSIKKAMWDSAVEQTRSEQVAGKVVI